MNEIETVTTYRVGGELFDTEAEARAHIASESVREQAMAYALARAGGPDGDQPAARTIARVVNVILGWEAWKASE